MSLWQFNIMIKENDLEKIKEFIAKKESFQLSRSSDPPFVTAATVGNYDVCALLLDSGFSASSSNYSRESALQRAAGSNHYDIVRLILERGKNLDINHRDMYGKTALFSALCYYEIGDRNDNWSYHSNEVYKKNW